MNILNPTGAHRKNVMIRNDIVVKRLRICSTDAWNNHVYVKFDLYLVGLKQFFIIHSS